MIFANMLYYLRSSERKSWKSSGQNGTRTLISAMPLQCSTIWAIRPTESWPLWVYVKPVDWVVTCVLINEISFELRMKTVSMVMIYAVMLCFRYCGCNLVPRVFRLPTRGSGGKRKDPGNEVAAEVAWHNCQNHQHWNHFHPQFKWSFIN